MQREKLVVLFTVFVDVTGFGIVIPILPFYVGSFGASPFVITLLFASFAFFAFLSSPFLGALSNKIGRRPVLITSITSTAIGWFVFAGATGIPRNHNPSHTFHSLLHKTYFRIDLIICGNQPVLSNSHHCQTSRNTHCKKQRDQR